MKILHNYTYLVMNVTDIKNYLQWFLRSSAYNTETPLQFSEDTTLFAVCRIYTGVVSKET
jgi:hypothetical protein